MIRDLSFKEVMQVEVIGDPLTAGDIKHARKGAREYPGSWIVVMLTKTGARLEVTSYRTGFKWRLNGYASDGSDVGLAPEKIKVPPKEPKYGGLWGLFDASGFGQWMTVPFENPLKDFLLFESKEKAEQYIRDNSRLYGNCVPKPKHT